MNNNFLYCFIDTNTFLHYRMFTEIDWCKEFEASHVTLVVCSAVIRELDKKKFSDPDAKVRGRAKKVITKLSEVGNKSFHVQVKPGVELLFITREPIIDWNAEGLSPDINDDRVIAAILSEESMKSNVALVTSDLGMKLKAQSKGIRFHSLPDTLKLAEKKSPEEEENIKLRERLSRLENSLPILRLKLTSEQELLDFARFSFKKMPPLSTTDIEAELNQIKKNLEYIPPAPRNAINALLLPLGVSQNEIERYNKEVEEYIKEMSEYLKAEWEYKEICSREVELKFILVNHGSSPAEDIDVFLHFPNGFILIGEDKLPKAPHRPEDPVAPRTMAEMFTHLGKMNYPDLLRAIVPPTFSRHPKLEINRGPYIKKTKSYEVTYHEQKLKHGLQVELDPVYVIFPSIDSAHSFNIDYSLFAANVPEEVKGRIHIIIDIENS